MKNVMRKYENDFIVEEYLTKYDPRQAVSIGFSIPDAYRYAESLNKKINELSEEEIKQFAISQ